MLLLTVGWYIVWHASSQAKSICIWTYDGKNVWSHNLYAGHYQCYDAFDTSMATGQVVDSQWLFLVVGHLC